MLHFSHVFAFVVAFGLFFPGVPAQSYAIGSDSTAFSNQPAALSYTGWVDEDGNPTDRAHAIHWCDKGAVAHSKFFFDSSTNGWYWAESNGSIAISHDAFVPRDNSVAGDSWETGDDGYRRSNGKWVRLGPDGRMVKGEDLKNSKWFYFDPITGEMAKGIRHIDSDGGK